MNHFIAKLFITIASLLLISTHIYAETRYVTDEFKVTLRTGASTSNSIVSMLKSGESIRLIEHDEETKYSLVETSKGKQGYILTRYLNVQPSGREQFKTLKVKSAEQLSTINTLKAELATLKEEKMSLSNNVSSLQSKLDSTSEELTQLKQATSNTVAIIQKNKNQLQLIEQLKKEKSELLEENAEYKDSTAMDWFIRGSGVFLLAFLIGIIVTRIQWQKRDSWNDF